MTPQQPVTYSGGEDFHKFTFRERKTADIRSRDPTPNQSLLRFFASSIFTDTLLELQAEIGSCDLSSYLSMFRWWGYSQVPPSWTCWWWGTCWYQVTWLLILPIMFRWWGYSQVPSSRTCWWRGTHWYKVMWLLILPVNVQVVRIFTSSTFTEMLMERNTLI